MSEKGHWPFSGDDAGHGARGSDRVHDLRNDKAIQAQQATMRQRMRFDRLIVGGRAHGKKPGLS